MIQPELLTQFSFILRVITSMFPGSSPVIGGGALRDAFHDRPIKDVDVFIRAKDYLNLDHPDTSPIVPPGVAEYVCRADMHGVWNLRFPILGYEVQPILADFNGPVDLAHSFDLGLSRVTFDGAQVHYTDEFLEDSFNKQFVIRRADDDGQTERSEKRIDRLLAKYPEFKRAA